MRPRYESQRDRDNAMRVMQIVAGTLGAKVTALSHEYPVNFALHRNGHLMTLVEVKCRTTPMHKYPSLIMACRRLDRALEFAKTNGVPLIVVTKWADRLGYLKVKDTSVFAHKLGGRTDRNDLQDIEQLYDLPVEMFKLFPAEAE